MQSVQCTWTCSDVQREMLRPFTSSCSWLKPNNTRNIVSLFKNKNHIPRNFAAPASSPCSVGIRAISTLTPEPDMEVSHNAQRPLQVSALSSSSSSFCNFCFHHGFQCFSLFHFQSAVSSIFLPLSTHFN